MVVVPGERNPSDGSEKNAWGSGIVHFFVFARFFDSPAV
jgi:hypothetical protein